MMASLKNKVQDINTHSLVIKMTGKTKSEHKFHPEKFKEVKCFICALLNSGGGKLELYWVEENIKKISSCIRMIEQHVMEMIGVAAMTELVQIQVNQQEIIISIKESTRLVTINYNLYLPTQCQINVIPATTHVRHITHLLKRKIVDDSISNNSHMKIFRKSDESGLQEGYGVQLKLLKDTPTKNVTLADRIAGKSNKLQCYISAFANHRGGHLYYGISEDGLVVGQCLNEKEKYEIEKKVEKAIKKMIWPPQIESEKGKQWDIFFEPVLDDGSFPLSSLFVIVIYIAPCSGGVFPEEPESYYIDKGQVTKMRFEEWWGKFNTVSVVKNVPRLQWSSQANQRVFRHLTTKFVQYRNDENMKDFEELKSKAITTFPKYANVEHIIMTECVTLETKKLSLRKADQLLKEFQELLSASSDKVIFEVRMLFVKSRLELTEGNYLKSYETTTDGLQKMTMIPLELHSLFFYMEACLLTIILSTNEQGVKEKALDYLNLAERYVNSIENITSEKMSDFLIKLHIHRALIHLGCCITGEMELRTPPTKDDIKAAAKDLATVEEITFQGHHRSRFRQIEYNLAKCDLLNRRFELFQEGNSVLKVAYKFAEKAHKLAKTHHFQNMVHYATIRQRNITVRLVSIALCSRNKHQDEIY